MLKGPDAERKLPALPAAARQQYQFARNNAAAMASRERTLNGAVPIPLAQHQNKLFKPQSAKKPPRKREEEEDDGALELFQAVAQGLQTATCRLDGRIAENLLRWVGGGENEVSSPLCRFMAEALELVYVRRDNPQSYKQWFELNERAEWTCFVQCKYCHANHTTNSQGGNNVKNKAAYGTARHSMTLAGDMVRVLYHHCTLCRAVPTSQIRRFQHLKLRPKTPEFERFANATHKLCFTLIKWIDQSYNYQVPPQHSDRVWGGVDRKRLRRLLQRTKRIGFRPYPQPPHKPGVRAGSQVLDCEIGPMVNVMSGQLEYPVLRPRKRRRMSSSDKTLQATAAPLDQQQQQQQPKSSPSSKVVQVEYLSKLKLGRPYKVICRANY